MWWLFIGFLPLLVFMLTARLTYSYAYRKGIDYNHPRPKKLPLDYMKIRQLESEIYGQPLTGYDGTLIRMETHNVNAAISPVIERVRNAIDGAVSAPIPKALAGMLATILIIKSIRQPAIHTVNKTQTMNAQSVMATTLICILAKEILVRGWK